MIIVTGGAGFIGSNLIKQLNLLGYTDILLVDNLKNGEKVKNINNVNIADFVDKDDFYHSIEKFVGKEIKHIFHLGACSSTQEWDGKYLMINNYEFSKKLLTESQKFGTQFVYASSASVYGSGKLGFKERTDCERPINAYAYSKWLFDNFVRRNMNTLRSVVGLRYFNVYGPNEAHKKDMISAPRRFYQSAINTSKIELFGGYDGYQAGEQIRDFVNVQDCVAIQTWLLDNPSAAGIFNVGSGQASTFKTMATTIAEWFFLKLDKNIDIEYIPFPEKFKGSYQSYTLADLTQLRRLGYNQSMIELKEGVFNYCDELYKETFN